MNAADLSKFLLNCTNILSCAAELKMDITKEVVSTIQGTLERSFPTPLTGFKLTGFDGKTVPILTTNEIYAGINNGKIDAVRLYKNRTQLSLLDSKHAVEQWFHDHNLIFYTVRY